MENQKLELEKIEIPYFPRKIWAEKIHPALDKYKRAVLVVHRQMGKTTGSVGHIVPCAIKNNRLMPRYAYIAPYRNQAKNIAWEKLKAFVSCIPGIKFNESELYVEFPTKHKGAAGARIYIVGADNPDVLRGLYWDGVIFDEYADIKPEVWSKIVMPGVISRGGFAWFLGTPKGENQFYEIYKHAKAHPKKTKESPAWYTLLLNVYQTGIFTEEQINEAKANMTEIAFRQEYMCDFTASATNAVIPIELIDKAVNQKLTEKDIPKDEPIILGVDVARFGDDRTTIWKRQGLWVEKPRVYTKLDVTEVGDRIIFAINQYHPDMVFVDSGSMGAGVIDYVRRLGYTNVQEVAFGSKALDMDHYENIRAEMYFKLKACMEKGMCLPNDLDLRQELAVIDYEITRRGRIKLVPKDLIKEKLGRSPDLADGLALTFAKPVNPVMRYLNNGLRNKQMLMCNTEYTCLSEDNLRFQF